MKGGYVRLVAIESKSFDLRVVGNNEDILKISEHGRGRRFSIFLPEPVALWLLRACGRFKKSKSTCWSNQMRLCSRFYVLEFKSNLGGKFLKLSVSKEGNRAFVIFPTGPIGMIRVGLESLNPSMTFWINLLYSQICIGKEIVIKQ